MSSTTTSSSTPGTPATPPVPVKKPIQKRYIVAAVVCAGIAIWMLTVLKDNAVYLRTVSDAVEHRSAQGERTFRMGGTVVPGSIHRTSDGARFEVTEGGVTAAVDHHGDPPDLFKNCAPVVVEGHWAGTTFDSTRLLIKHGSDYDASKRTAKTCEAFQK
jgi:cytochrome c-type biogenesis protein CcmE